MTRFTTKRVAAWDENTPVIASEYDTELPAPSVLPCFQKL